MCTPTIDVYRANGNMGASADAGRGVCALGEAVALPFRVGMSVGASDSRGTRLRGVRKDEEDEERDASWTRPNFSAMDSDACGCLRLFMFSTSLLLEVMYMFTTICAVTCFVVQMSATNIGQDGLLRSSLRLTRRSRTSRTSSSLEAPSSRTVHQP